MPVRSYSEPMACLLLPGAYPMEGRGDPDSAPYGAWLGHRLAEPKHCRLWRLPNELARRAPLRAGGGRSGGGFWLPTLGMLHSSI